jgi:hypothetical protein
MYLCHDGHCDIIYRLTYIIYPNDYKTFDAFPQICIFILIMYLNSKSLCSINAITAMKSPESLVFLLKNHSRLNLKTYIFRCLWNSVVCINNIHISRGLWLTAIWLMLYCLIIVKRRAHFPLNNDNSVAKVMIFIPKTALIRRQSVNLFILSSKNAMYRIYENVLYPNYERNTCTLADIVISITRLAYLRLFLNSLICKCNRNNYVVSIATVANIWYMTEQQYLLYNFKLCLSTKLNTFHIANLKK